MGNQTQKTEATSILQRHWVEEAELNEVLMQIIMEQRKERTEQGRVWDGIWQEEKWSKLTKVSIQKNALTRLHLSRLLSFIRRHVILYLSNVCTKIPDTQCLLAWEIYLMDHPSFRSLWNLSAGSSHMGEPLDIKQVQEWLSESYRSISELKQVFSLGLTIHRFLVLETQFHTFIALT